jgi:hypothetical protein
MVSVAAGVVDHELLPTEHATESRDLSPCEFLQDAHNQSQEHKSRRVER